MELKTGLNLSDYASLNEFWVRLRIKGDASQAEEPVVFLRNLHIESGIETASDRVIELVEVPGQENRVQYDENFLSQKYRYYTRAQNENQLDWSKGQIGVRLRPGGSAVTLVWKVVSEEPLHQIHAQLEGHANPINLGTNHYFDISTDGETWLYEATTSGKEGDVNGNVRENLLIDTGTDERFHGVREFYVRVRMNANNFQEIHPNLSGVVKRLLITATPIASEE
ncbi:MAG: hypothetical protein R3C11_17795 [Planctomycetaceae bacterium]